MEKFFSLEVIWEAWGKMSQDTAGVYWGRGDGSRRGIPGQWEMVILAHRKI